MAVTLTITVTNAQATRAQTAYGHLDTDPLSPTFNTWVLATAADMQNAIKAWVKSRVVDYETSLTAVVDRNTRSAEIW